MRPPALDHTTGTTRATTVRSHMGEGAVLSCVAALVGWFAFVFTPDASLLSLIFTVLTAAIPGVVAGGIFHAMFTGRTPRRPGLTLAAGAVLAAVTAAAAFVNYGRIFTAVGPGALDDLFAPLAVLVTLLGALLGVSSGRRTLAAGTPVPPPFLTDWGPHVRKGPLGNLIFHMCAGATIAVVVACVAFYEAPLQFPTPEGWHEILAVIALMGLATGAGFSGVLSLAVVKADSAPTAVTCAALFATVVEVAVLSPLMAAYESSGSHGWARLAVATAVTIALSVLLARASLLVNDQQV